MKFNVRFLNPHTPQCLFHCQKLAFVQGTTVKISILIDHVRTVSTAKNPVMTQFSLCYQNLKTLPPRNKKVALKPLMSRQEDVTCCLNPVTSRLADCHRTKRNILRYVARRHES